MDLRIEKEKSSETNLHDFGVQNVSYTEVLLQIMAP